MNSPILIPAENEILAYLKQVSPEYAYKVVRVSKTHFLCLCSEDFGFGIATELLDDWHIQIDQQFS